jgi:hypothetical protein
LALAGMDDMDRFVLESVKPSPEFSNLVSETALLYMEASLNFRLGEPWKEVETIGTSENNFTVKAQLINGEYVVNGDDIKTALGEMYNTIKSQTNKVLPTPDMPEITNGVDHIIGIDLEIVNTPDGNEEYALVTIEATTIKAIDGTTIQGVETYPVGIQNGFNSWPMNSSYWSVRKGINCQYSQNATGKDNAYNQIEMRMNGKYSSQQAQNVNSPWYWSEVKKSSFHYLDKYGNVQYPELWHGNSDTECLNRDKLIQYNEAYDNLIGNTLNSPNVISVNVGYDQWGKSLWAHGITAYGGKKKYVTAQ